MMHGQKNINSGSMFIVFLLHNFVPSIKLNL